MTTAGARLCAALGLAAALGLVATAWATEAPAVSRHVLPNGMTILVRESRAARVVALSLQVAAGSATETAATAGITNFVQRTMVRGTARRTATQIADAAADLGGSVDASGDVDHAEVHGHALAGHWQALLDLVADVALAPAFALDEVERTRRVILGRIRARADTALAFAMDTMMRELYGPHPYALPTAGQAESVASITRDALVEHYHRVYRPDRLVLAVSGDVPRERVVRHAQRLFGKVPRRAPVSEPPPATPETTGARRVVVRPAQQAQVLVGYLGPRIVDADYAATKVLVALIGGGTSGRLFQEIRERRGLAYAVGVLNASRVGRSALVSYLGTEAGNVEAAEAGVGRELARVRAEPPSDDELARAKAYVGGVLAMDRRTNARQAWYLAFFELAGVGWDFPDRYARAVEAVSAADVAAAARRYLERPTTVVLTPPR